MAFSGSFHGLHMQDPVRDWDRWYRLAHEAGRAFRILKSFHPEDQPVLRQASPSTVHVMRPWIGEVNTDPWLRMAAQGPSAADAAADDYILRWKDSANEWMRDGFVESLNEEYPTRNPTKLGMIVAFDRAFVRRLRVHCPHVRPVVFCAAVGNPDHHEYGALVNLARETASVGGAFGYHGYWTVYRREDGSRVSFMGDPGVRRDLHMRWEVIDEFLIGKGIRVNWMIGESGATKGNESGYSPDVIAGWKHEECWGGSEDGYLADIAQHDRLLWGTRAAREGRLLGVTLFTSKPNPGVWQYFNVTGSMLERLGNYVATEDGGPVTDPPPPPDPPDPPEPPDPPSETVLEASERENLWEISVVEQIRDGISLNPGAKLQSAILGDRFVPVLSEKRYFSADRRVWAWQPAERVAGDLARRVYVCEVVTNGSVSYGQVFYFLENGDLGQPGGAEAGLVLPPVGTEEERMSERVWPGEWKDANPYGSLYILRGQNAYHTGADLNLNSPTWNSDRGAPVFACADGVVTYAGRFNENWGNLVVIRHSAAGGFYSRSAHLAEVLVEEGDVVSVGVQVGTIGGSDVNLPDHLHFDISPSDVLGRNPGDWPGGDIGRLRRDYVDPKQFIEDAFLAFLEDRI